MKKGLISAICIATSLSIGAAYSIELPVKPVIVKPSLSSITPTKSGNQAAMQSQVKNVINSSDAITVSFNDAVLNLSSILLTKESVIELKTTKEALLAKTKNKEAGAVDAELVTEASAKLNAALQQEDMSARIKGLSAQQKQLMTDCTFNILLASLGYLDLANESLTLVNQVTADPVSAVYMGKDLKELKKIAANLPKQGKAAGQIGAGLIKVAKAGGIKIPQPTSKTAKPKILPKNAF